MLKVDYVRSEEDPARIDVWIEGEFWNSVSGQVFRRLKGLPRQVESEAALRQWFHEEESKRARAAAMRLLAAQSLHSRQFEERLQRWGYGPEITAQVAEACIESGYIDDAEWALSYAKGLKRRRYGKQYVYQRLQQKKVPDRHIQTVLSELYESDSLGEIRELLDSRYSKRNLSDPKELRKVAAALCRRGFQPQEVWDCLRQ